MPTKSKAPANWRNRIVGHGEEDAGQLLANPKNWRVHPKQQQAALEGVLAEVGWVQDVIVNRRTGHVVDGHLRVSLAISRGERVPVVYVELDEREEALILATIDPLAALAGTDGERLRDLVADLHADNSALEELLHGEDGSKAAEGEDEAPEPPALPISQSGDLWLCGPHRVLCGDSTSTEAVSRLLSPTLGILQPFLMVTDPPYGVEYDPGWRSEVNNDGPNSKRALGKVRNDDCVDWSPAYALFPGDVAYVWHAGVFAGDVAVGLFASGLEIRAQIIWAKSQIVFGRGAYHWQHEPCWYVVRKGKSAHWHGDRSQSTLWQIEKPRNSETGHGTQKPVECMRRPILNHTEPGEAVYDPFLGSGTTLIAAELTQRICYGLELDPVYVDVIVRRWEKQSGGQATLDGDGRTFDEVAGERIGKEA